GGGQGGPPRSATRPTCPCEPTPREGSRALFRKSVGAYGLAEPSGDVRLCPAVLRLVEEVARGRELDQLAIATLRVHEHERGEVGHTRGLLHVVRDDDDRVVVGQLDHEVLDL